jgi:superfamily I DNA and/or RNA helicase
MRRSIAGFSSERFYGGQLGTAIHLGDTGIHLTFIDTAGTGYDESAGADGNSLQNEGELGIVAVLLERHGLDPGRTAFISPYAGQVAAAAGQLPADIRKSTVDSFQGQEMENVVLSLVRSNEDGVIGFLRDYRRMNVAMTRARERLYVIGDSATIGSDPFYNAFLSYVEKVGEYDTAWAYM